MATETWHVELLGGLRARRQDAVLGRFQTRHVASLFAYLAYHAGVRTPREELAAMLWPSADPGRRRQSLRQALLFLRRRLQEPGAPAEAVVQADFGGIYIAKSAITTDVSAFRGLCASWPAGEDPCALRDRLASAAALYSGPLLPELDDLWIEPERQRLRDLYLGVLRRLIRLHAEARELDAAIELAHRAVREDPYREESYRALMQLYATVGRPAAARIQFAELERHMAELGVSPSAESIALAERIAAGRSFAPRSVSNSRSTIPAASSRMYGRAEEREKLLELLTSDRIPLVTLTGPGGIGKTRLALETARDLYSAMVGCVYFVSLADLRDPAEIAGALLEALPAEKAPHQPALAQAVRFLAASPALVILDNFERLLPGGRAAVLAIQKGAPHTTLLVTSRVRLRIPDEREMRLSLLPVPESNPGAARALEEFPSVALFADRARSARLDFRLSSQNAAATAEICRRLEGLPLALELAAARVALQTPAQILDGLTDRFRILTARGAEKSDRQRSLWAAIEWSVDLLPQRLRRFFSRLSVFRGGWTADAAALVALEADTVVEPKERYNEALEMLDRLRAHSLIEEDERGGELRYRMLETVREFAWEGLSEEDREEVSNRHAAWSLRLAEEAWTHRLSPTAESHNARLDAEMDNLRAALAFESARAGGRAIRLAGALGGFWYFRGHLFEARRWLDPLLRRSADAEVADLARAAHVAGLIALDQCDLRNARRYFLQALSHSEHQQDHGAVARILHNLGHIASMRGSYSTARRQFEKALWIARQHGDDVQTGIMLSSYGLSLFCEGESARAEALCEQAHGLLKTGEHGWALANNLLSLALIALGRGDLSRAESLCRQALDIHQRAESARGIALARHYLGLTALRRSDRAAARSQLSDALDAYARIGDENGIAEAFEALAESAVSGGNPRLAAELFGAAAAIRARLGVPVIRVLRSNYDRCVAETARALGRTEFESAWSEGAARSLGESLRLAHALRENP